MWNQAAWLKGTAWLCEPCDVMGTDPTCWWCGHTASTLVTPPIGGMLGAAESIHTCPTAEPYQAEEA